ncbi:MAG: nitroreductase family protein [Promethearchaeota archaeon]|nr:MAG: nitroreductase family protein [Candidatus Lokiarchaeota archaeon]
MPIEGIDTERCNLCNECIEECPLGNFHNSIEEQQIIFDNSQGCILCGHCIAVCPENAIIYRNMNGETLDFEVSSKSVSYEAIQNLMRIKRSIRQYEYKKVTAEIIEKVVDCMKYAAVAMNKRTLKCLIISDDRKIKELIEKIIEAVEPEEEREIYKKKREEGIDPFFHNAPHIFIFHSDNNWDTKNASICITYAMLCAQTLGLGSCWIGGVQVFLNENKEIQKELFDINDKIVGIMILGYPKVKYYKIPPRPPLETQII